MKQPLTTTNSLLAVWDDVLPRLLAVCLQLHSDISSHTASRELVVVRGCFIHNFIMYSIQPQVLCGSDSYSHAISHLSPEFTKCTVARKIGVKPSLLLCRNTVAFSG